MKEGQLWITRAGRLVEIYKAEDPVFCWVGVDQISKERINYRLDGRWHVNPKFHSAKDLINLVKDAPMEKINKFNPNPGDKIICNNGAEFICCTLEELKSKGVGSYIKEDMSICGIAEDWEDGHSWMYWEVDNYPNDHEWEIREVIPAQKEGGMTEDSKEEPKYTAEDIRNAFTALEWETTSYQKLIETLNKAINPEYLEYLRLKAIYE